MMTYDICPFCGAYSPRSCELEEELAGAECPWKELIADEPDPDLLREYRNEMRRIFAEDRHDD